MNTIKTAAMIVVVIIAITTMGLFTGETPTENPPFITEQEISVREMAGILLFSVVALLYLKATTKRNRRITQQ